MSATETVTIDLSPEAALALREAIASGDFADAGAAINAIVRSWDAGSRVHGHSSEELDSLADEGERSGPGRDADFEAILRKARAGYEAAKTGP